MTAWPPECDIHHGPLAGPGAVLLGPPDDSGLCAKLHACRKCWLAIVIPALSELGVLRSPPASHTDAPLKTATPLVPGSIRFYVNEIASADGPQYELMEVTVTNVTVQVDTVDGRHGGARLPAELLGSTPADAFRRALADARSRAREDMDRARVRTGSLAALELQYADALREAVSAVQSDLPLPRAPFDGSFVVPGGEGTE